METYLSDQAKGLVTNLKFAAIEMLRGTSESPDLENSLQLHTFSKRARRVIALQAVAFARYVQVILDLNQRKKFRIGVLGCGTVGSSIVRALLASGYFSGDDIIVASRKNSGQEIQRLAAAGVRFDTDNITVARSCRLIYLATLPAQIQTVAKSVKDKLRSTALICSVVAGVGIEKVRRLFDCNFVVRTNVRHRWISSDAYSGDLDPLRILAQDLLTKYSLQSSCGNKISPEEIVLPGNTTDRAFAVHAGFHLASDSDTLISIANTFEDFQASLPSHVDVISREVDGSPFPYLDLDPETAEQQQETAGRSGSSKRKAGQDTRHTNVSKALFGCASSATEASEVLQREDLSRAAERATRQETTATRQLRERFVENFASLVKVKQNQKK